MKQKIISAQEQRECLGKIKHKSIIAVEYELDELKKTKKGKEKIELHYYKCSFCEDYHIGHKSHE